MMNNNKILTVSYGTFSCTLEGFEDSFGTMKVIAEYFRDLAADDRYFGAEPPQPDADLLARIAQKEVSRKVEARQQDGKIVLSALENASGSDVAAPVAAIAAAGFATLPEEDSTADEAPSEKAAEAIEDAVVEDVAAEEVTLDAVAEDISDASDIEIEEIAEDAAPVEAVSTDDVDDAIEEDDADAQITEIDEIDEIDVTEAEDEIVAADEAIAVVEDGSEEEDLASETAVVEDENDIVPGQPDAEVSAFFATEEPAKEASAPAAEADLEDDQASDAPAPGGIAAKLQRIRAVVAQHDDSEDADDYLEDEHAVAETAGLPDATEQAAKIEDDADELMLETRADIEDALDADEMTDLQAASDEETLEGQDDNADEVNAILSRLDADAEEASEPQNTDDTALDDVALEEAAQDTSVEDTVNNLFEEEEEATLATDADTKDVAQDIPPLRIPRDQVVKSEKAADPKPSMLRTRVIKVKRADLDAAIEKGDLEEYGDKDEDDALTAAVQAATGDTSGRGLDDLAPAKSDNTALSADQQDELARELAALEDDIAKVENTGVAAAAPQEQRKRPVSSRGILPQLDEKRGSAVSRLLAETDHQMDEPESATRRDAFAHLRAAVAAKKADDSMSGGADTLGGDDAYREDLAEVVRPRRPMSGPPQTARPTDSHAAPLKLVAEQRIDAEDEAEVDTEVEAVTPRRVAAVEDAPQASAKTDDFAKFASEMNATTLPQLLEAAAAYMSFVEGREQFSRPQLMTKVRQAEGQEGFSREDGLRSFGQLLRAGKIEKLKGGRFTVSDDIGYRPDQRAVG